MSSDPKAGLRLATTAVSEGSVAGLRAALEMVRKCIRNSSEAPNVLDTIDFVARQALAATPSAETDAQVAVLREALGLFVANESGERTLEQVLNAQKVYDNTAPAAKDWLKEHDLLVSQRAIHNAKDYEAAVVAPWRELVRELEWSGRYGYGPHDMEHRCPVCNGEEARFYPDDQTGGHRRDCKLALLLASTETAAQQEGAGDRG